MFFVLYSHSVSLSHSHVHSLALYLSIYLLIYINHSFSFHNCWSRQTHARILVYLMITIGYLWSLSLSRSLSLSLYLSIYLFLLLFVAFIYRWWAYHCPHIIAFWTYSNYSVVSEERLRSYRTLLTFFLSWLLYISGEPVTTRRY